MPPLPELIQQIRQIADDAEHLAAEAESAAEVCGAKSGLGAKYAHLSGGLREVVKKAVADLRKLADETGRRPNTEGVQ